MDCNLEHKEPCPSKRNELKCCAGCSLENECLCTPCMDCTNNNCCPQERGMFVGCHGCPFSKFGECDRDLDRHEVDEDFPWHNVREAKTY